MNKNPANLLILIILVLLAVIVYRYDQYILKKNFLLNIAANCDPSIESCFVVNCSPEEDEECDQTPYKKIEILASEAPMCLQEHSCDSFECESGTSCVAVYCSENTLEEWEVCSLPIEGDEAVEETIISNESLNQP
jgi:hypothetical protein